MNETLVETLGSARDDVLAEAAQALARAHLEHYEAAGEAESAARLAQLFDLLLASLEQRSLVDICRHAETVAEQRFEAGFDVGEVQTGFNVLEEAIWRVVVTALPPEELVDATGLIGTVLGAGKDALARRWVSLATRQHVPSLDMSALFGGTGG